jgi:hypothetical protein
MLNPNQIAQLKKDSKETEKKIILALKYHDLEDQIDLEKIKKLFTKAKHPIEGIMPILDLPDFENKEELESFANLLRDFWNNIPRTECKGASLLEIEERRLRQGQLIEAKKRR